MSAGARWPDVPPAASPVGQASASPTLDPTPDPTPFPIELVELVELDGPGTICRLDGTCD